MRIIGLDFGSKTVGVAVSDPFGWTAQGLEIIRREDENNLKKTIARIKELCKEYSAEYILLGLPKNMNNTAGERVEKTLLFKKRLLKEVKLPVILWDERLSTVGAERVLLSADISRAKRKKVIDKQAAVFILQGFLDSKPDIKKILEEEKNEQ
ncbi:MAG TPA: Holliday junction resolvase RuvX [Lachnospiraceae bacterium]|nr:Holliday junction resolvase RuvX [Lachnospiraceae bacterium]